MGYKPTPEDQWTQDDLDRAGAANDYSAINKARAAGALRDLLEPTKELSDADRLAAVLTPPAGPTVPTQVPGLPMAGGNGSGAPMDQAELDRLGAVGDYAAINLARREGRLSNLGVAPAAPTP